MCRYWEYAYHFKERPNEAKLQHNHFNRFPMRASVNLPGADRTFNVSAPLVAVITTSEATQPAPSQDEGEIYPIDFVFARYPYSPMSAVLDYPDPSRDTNPFSEMLNKVGSLMGASEALLVTDYGSDPNNSMTIYHADKLDRKTHAPVWSTQPEVLEKFAAYARQHALPMAFNTQHLQQNTPANSESSGTMKQGDENSSRPHQKQLDSADIGVLFPLHVPHQTLGFLLLRLTQPQLQNLPDWYGFLNYVLGILSERIFNQHNSATHLEVNPHKDASITADLAKRARLAIKLTRREIECLHWAAAGKTAWETGAIIQPPISSRTVAFHLSNASQKLGASNKRQAIVEAFKLGLLDLCKLEMDD